MIITYNPELRQSVFDTVRERMVRDREGIHLSDCNYCSRKTYFGKLHMTPAPSDELCLLWLSGYAFQTYMFPNNKEISIRIEGVDCTPDIASGIEVKSTRQSMKKFDLNEMEHWKRQILGYCKALNQLEYDLVVFFVCGNYAPPFPNLGCWHIQTTQEEVEANWKVVQDRADVIQESLISGHAPVPDCADWECSYCDSIELCQDYPQAQIEMRRKRLDKDTRR